MVRSATRRPTTLAPTASSPRRGWPPAWWRRATTSRVPAPSSADGSAGRPADQAAHQPAHQPEELGGRLRRDVYLRRHAAELSRLAVPLTGSADAGAAALVDAAARLPRRGTEVRFAQLAARALASAAAGAAVESLHGETARQRSA